MDLIVQEKILKFDSFINDVLKDDLAKLEAKLDMKITDVAEFVQLKNLIKTLNNTSTDSGFKTKVELENHFYIQAHVEDTSTILLDVGLGHFVEFRLDEALVIIDIRIKLLHRQIANLRTQIAKTKAHIKVILIGIHDLQKLNTMSTAKV